MSEEPRNKQQVYNARKNSKETTDKDEIFYLLELLKQHQSACDGGFRREVLIDYPFCSTCFSETIRQHCDVLLSREQFFCLWN